MELTRQQGKGSSFSITTLGVDRVNNAIKDLSLLDKERAIKSGLKALGSVFLSGGRKRLLARTKHKIKSTGGLYKSAVVKVKRDGRGVLTGFNKRGHHSHLVDMGTKRRFTNKGLNRGIMPANNFWKDTADQDLGKASGSMFMAIERSVDRIIARQ